MSALSSFTPPFQQWLQTPLGRYLLAAEQDLLNRWVSDVFGYRALQLGLPSLCGLQANRMPSRWVMDESFDFSSWGHEPETPFEMAKDVASLPHVHLCGEFHALPFPHQSIDLLVLPHTLELTSDPHAVLREIDRVLMPEGRVIVFGFHRWSLWGLAGRRWPSRQRIAYTRLVDWLGLLNFEVERSQFMAYCPPIQSQRWLQRFAWLDHWGYRCMPRLGGIYAVAAIKRVHGMRLIDVAKNHTVKRRTSTMGLVSPPVGQHIHHSPSADVQP
jgi:SAM-dependent methyltransferase